MLFFHGREAYRRNSYFILYNFYKNFLYVVTQFYFGFYSFFFYLFKTNMTGFFQFVYYFAYTGMMSILVFLVCGVISYTASSYFVWAIYARVKLQ